MKKLYYRAMFHLSELRCGIKWWLQRIFRGYSDNEVWNMYNELSRWVLRRLRVLRRVKYGHPTDITEEEWDLTLGELIKTFELIIEHDGLSGDKDIDERINKGLDLFREYFFSLWD